jgi:glycerophosphoryl diester phosphodiesterase
MTAFFALLLVSALPASADNLPREAQIGPRPFYLVDKMKDGPLKTELSQCTGPFHKSDFSIGHRGAALQFPEHSRESYLAAARMGAGVIECDVTFTKDRQLVCRHSQCDLHTTTNILSVPALAAKCTQPFSPADPRPERRRRQNAAPATSRSPNSSSFRRRWTASIRMRRRRKSIRTARRAGAPTSTPIPAR